MPTPFFAEDIMKFENVYDIIIIGAGPAGLTAAMYAGRAKMRVLVIEKEDNGGQIRITEEVANFPGHILTSGAELADTMRQQAENFGAKFVADAVVSHNLTGDIKELVGEGGMKYHALAVIIAAGARRRTLGFEGEAEFTGRGVAFCATCDGEFFNGKDVFVIGAGFAAAEEAIYLTRFAKQVTIIAREPDFTCSKTIGDKAKAHPKINIHFNTEVVSIGGDNLLKTAKFVNNITNASWEHNVEPEDNFFGVFVFAGYEPASDIFRGTIDTDAMGYISTNEDMQTNLKGVYAAGDVRPKRLRQLVTAVGDGAVAATAAEVYVAENRMRILPDFVEEKDDVTVSHDHITPMDESFFDAEVTRQIKYVIEHCQSKVTIHAKLDNSEVSDELRGFITMFADIAGQNNIALDIEENAAGELLPYIGFSNANGEQIPIYYHGVPGGHEFESFMLAIYNVAGPGQKLTEEQRARIASMPAFDLKIGISLSCTMCPTVVQAAQHLSSVNPKIVSRIIDLRHFPSLQEEHSIMSLPTVIINDGEEMIFGKKDLDGLLEVLLN